MPKLEKMTRVKLQRVFAVQAFAAVAVADVSTPTKRSAAAAGDLQSPCGRRVRLRREGESEVGPIGAEASWQQLVGESEVGEAETVAEAVGDQSKQLLQVKDIVIVTVTKNKARYDKCNGEVIKTYPAVIISWFHS